MSWSYVVILLLTYFCSFVLYTDHNLDDFYKWTTLYAFEYCMLAIVIWNINLLSLCFANKFIEIILFSISLSCLLKLKLYVHNVDAKHLTIVL